MLQCLKRVLFLNRKAIIFHSILFVYRNFFLHVETLTAVGEAPQILILIK